MFRWDLGPGHKPISRKKICALVGLILVVIALLRATQSPSQDEIRAIEFMKEWCRIRRLRVDWKQVLKPCKDHL